MNLFGPSSKKMVDKRVAQVKELAEKLHADYYYGIKNVKESFMLYDSEMEDSNVIAGNKDGYDYCFVEHFHEKSGKYDSSKWVSTLFVKMKYNNLPNFHLTTKSSAVTSSALGIFRGLGLTILSIFFLIIFFSSLKKNSGFDFIIFGFLFLLFLFSGLAFLYSNLKPMILMRNQDKYGIKDNTFKEKYTIISDDDPVLIRKFFTDEACAKIVNCMTDVDFEVYGNIVRVPFYDDAQLSYNSCRSYLDDLLYKARFFERPPDSLE